MPAYCYAWNYRNNPETRRRLTTNPYVMTMVSFQQHGVIATMTSPHPMYCSMPLFGAVGSDVGQMNEVTVRLAQLLLGWVG